MFSTVEIIDIAVQLEQNGAAFYLDAAEDQMNPILKSKLKSLADEETTHAEHFRNMRQSVKIDVVDPSLAKMGRRLFEQSMGQQRFSLTKENMERVRTVEDLVQLAAEFEKDTIIFYQMLQNFIEEKSALAQLEAIIEEERRHVVQLQTMVEDITM